jgi:2,5-diketo-D-gluconate reductase B
MISIPTITTQGVVMPKLGLGTFRLTGDDCARAVESALAKGYRHIDTAEMYGNEAGVGAGIAASGLPREKLFVTTKVWHDHLAPDAIRAALAASLDKLRLAYVDLYLIHWPAAGMNLGAALDTLQQLRADGLIKALGVANFTVPLLRQAVEEIKAPVACNQIEYHVLLGQPKVKPYLDSKGIPLVAYAPLAQGRLADQPELAAVARKHGVTPAQVALKWLLDQNGVAAIPKAGRAESQQANLDALKVTLDDDDRRVIAALPKDQRFVNPGFAPAWDAAA